MSLCTTDPTTTRRGNYRWFRRPRNLYKTKKDIDRTACAWSVKLVIKNCKDSYIQFLDLVQMIFVVKKTLRLLRFLQLWWANFIPNELYKKISFATIKLTVVAAWLFDSFRNSVKQWTIALLSSMINMHAYKKAFIELNVKLPTKIIFWVLKEI